MIEEQRNEFGRRIEEENNYRGRGGSDKFGYDRLKDIGEEIMGNTNLYGC